MTEAAVVFSSPPHNINDHETGDSRMLHSAHELNGLIVIGDLLFHGHWAINPSMGL